MAEPVSQSTQPAPEAKKTGALASYTPEQRTKLDANLGYMFDQAEKAGPIEGGVTRDAFIAGNREVIANGIDARIKTEGKPANLSAARSEALKNMPKEIDQAFSLGAALSNAGFQATPTPAKETPAPKRDTQGAPFANQEIAAAESYVAIGDALEHVKSQAVTAGKMAVSLLANGPTFVVGEAVAEKLGGLAGPTVKQPAKEDPALKTPGK